MTFKEFELKKNLQLFLLVAIVSFIPLLLHAVAFDTYRIWAFPFMLLFLGFWILSSKFSSARGNTQRLSVLEVAFFMVCLLIVTIVPNHLFDQEVEYISLIVRFILIVPILVILYFLKKNQI